MRPLVLSMIWIVNAAHIAAAASVPGPSAEESLPPAAQIGHLAQQIFAAADANHNDRLSRIEFARARIALLEQLQTWGQQGLLGKPLKKKRSSGGEARSAAVGRATIDGAVDGEKLARSNHVSMSDFLLYAHQVLTETDEIWRIERAAVSTERKAAATRAKLLREQRRAGYTHGRTVYGLPYVPPAMPVYPGVVP